MGNDRTGRRRTARTHPVAGQVLFEGSGDLPRGMEDPFPLKFCTVRVWTFADYPSGAPVATQVTDSRGRFAFARDELGGRATRDLIVDVQALNPRGLRVCHGGARTPWAFLTLEAVGHTMRITVPSGQWESVELFTTFPTPRPASVQEEHDLRQAFRAFAVLSQMRSWLWREGANTAQYPWVHGVTTIYPATGSWHMGRELFLGSSTRAGLRRSDQYTLSALAHEYGHHIMASLAPRAPIPGGSHTWTEDLPRDDDGLWRRLGLDFSEGYSTFIGQCFLNDRTYTYAGGSTYDLESPVGCAGDWPTAGYLWDLVDGVWTTDQVDLRFFEVHRELAAFADAREDRLLTLPDFHDHLQRSSMLMHHLGIATQLDVLLDQNRLRDAHRRWRAAPAAVRDRRA